MIWNIKIFLVVLPIMNYKKLKTIECNQIGKILKSQAHKGKRQLLVRWPGYNSDFVSFIATGNVNNP